MELRIATALDEIPARDWNALRGTENPFLRHELLAALERRHCIHPGNGWQPHHLLLYDESRLIAAAPAYLKGHSWGEFVFDFSWADAYARHGLDYYPKLVVAVPYSPVTGARALVHPDSDESVIDVLAREVKALARERRLSSVHWLFTTHSQTERLRAQGYAVRTGYQYHWQNDGYRDFADFLDRFSAKKRKNVRQERQKVAAAGFDFHIHHGRAISSDLWRRFYGFYRDTFRAHGNVPVLNQAFFEDIGHALGDEVLLVTAERAGDVTAGALLLQGDQSMYGRYWGAAEEVPGLHFETCYYRPIDYAIGRGLQRFEPGAQGEHKVARGFLPTATYSAHWLAEPAMHAAVEDFVRREQVFVEEHMEGMRGHSPYR